MFNLDALDPSGDIRTVADDAGAFDPSSSRRDLLKRAGLGGAAVVGASSALGLLSPFQAWASSTTGAFSRTHKSLSNDVKIGNYALTLEYLESAFYGQAVQNGKLIDPDIAQFAVVVSGHETAHVTALKKVLGKAAVKSPTVNFGTAVTDQTTFLRAAAALEPVGTAAYAGAGPYIKTLSILEAALSIHSVEANHAAWAATLLHLKGIDVAVIPAPNAFNPAYSYSKVLKAVGKTGYVTGNIHP